MALNFTITRRKNQKYNLGTKFNINKLSKMDDKVTTEEFQKYQEQTFDSFCKKVIRNEAISIFREIKARAEREVPISELSEMEAASLCTVDTYHTYTKEYIVLGHIVKVHDPTIGEVLQYIQPQLRNIILLSFYLNYSDIQIAKLLNISSSTVSHRKKAALRKLKGQIENMDNDRL